MHRSASEGMVTKPSKEAEKVRRRKLAKELRAKIASGDMHGVAKLYIDASKVPPAPPADQECPECRRLNAPRGIVPLHIFAA